MKSDLPIFFNSNKGIELIYSKNSNFAYPKHTHSFNYVVVFILAGSVFVERGVCRITF